MAEPEEEEPDVAATCSELGNGVDDGHRIEPVPDPAGPDENPVVHADSVDDAAEHARGHRRVGRDAEGHDVDQTSERRVAVESVVVDAAGLQQRAEPKIPLSLARAHERVPGPADDGI